MNANDDKAAVLAVLEAETAAFLMRDPDAMAAHWLHSSDARRMHSHALRGVRVFEGWEAIDAHHRSVVSSMPNSFAETRIRRERKNVVVNGDTAWVTYDQIGDEADDQFYMTGMQHELTIFHRIAGQWKMACVVVMQRAIDHETCPLIEVGPDKRVLWMNRAAHAQISGHRFLLISAGRVRARNRSHEAGLQKAVDWAESHLQGSLPPSPSSRVACAVILGEDENDAPVFCWVLFEDGKILVTFDDEQQLKRRIAIAQGIYGLTAAQAQLAMLVAKGLDLATAAERLGISINTVRTHLQRMFDRTGTHSQSALVGLLLSAEAPTAR